MKIRSHHPRQTLLAILALAAASSASAATYYVSPNGNDNNPGTIDLPWKTFFKAQSMTQPNDTVYFRGGRYVYDESYNGGVNTCLSNTDTVNANLINHSGFANKMIRYWAYPGETPVFDFTNMKDQCRVKGFNISTSYIHIKGFEVVGAPQQPGITVNNESWGIWINGNHNIVEMVNTHHNMGPGLFISQGSDNLILNVDSHDNYDPYSRTGAGQNADGFGVHIGANRPNNVVRGCRAWNNTDDGYDLIGAGSAVTIENSWAWSMGYYPGTTNPIPAGNGNGFKMGGFGGVWAANAPQHIIRNSVAFNNKASGFYANHHPVANLYYNNTSINNHPDYNMLGIAQDGSAVNLGVLRNNIAYLGSLTSNMSTDTAYNSWTLPVTVNSADFQSVSTTGWDAPRLPDGSLPPMPMFHLVSGSDLIDKGIDVGLPYTGAAPDLGAFEGSTPVPLYTDVTASTKIAQSGLTPNRTTGLWNGTVTFTNTTSAALSGSLLFRLDNLSAGVTLANQTGSQGGSPTLSLPMTSLAPGQSISFITSFQNPNRVIVNYTPKLFTGTL